MKLTLFVFSLISIGFVSSEVDILSPPLSVVALTDRIDRLLSMKKNREIFGIENEIMMMKK